MTLIRLLPLLLFIIPQQLCAQTYLDTEMSLREAYALFQQDTNAEAVRIYEQIIEQERRADAQRSHPLAESLKQAGFAYTNIGQYDKAIRYFDESIAINTRLGLDLQVGICLIGSGNAYQLGGKPETALKKLREALSILPRSDHQDLVGIAIGYSSRAYNDLGKYADALTYKLEAIDIFRKIQKQHDLVIFLSDIGEYYIGWGRFDEAMKSYEEAVGIDRRMQYRDRLAADLNGVGRVYAAWGQWDKALRSFEESLGISGALKDDNLTASVLHNIGQCHEALGHADKAFDFFEQSLAISRRSGAGPNTTIAGIDGLGLSYYNRGKRDLAIRFLEEGLAISRRTKDRAGLRRTLLIIGKIKIVEGKFTEARTCFAEALTHARQEGNVDDEASSLSQLALVDYRLGNQKSAIRTATEAVALYEKMYRAVPASSRRDYFDRQIFTFQLLAAAYLKDNDVANAYRTIETSRAKVLRQQMAHTNEPLAIPSLSQIQKVLPEDAAVLVYANTDWVNPLIIVITSQEIYGTETLIRDALVPLSELNEEPASADGRGIAIVNKDAEAAAKQTRGANEITLANIAGYYRSGLARADTRQRGVAVRQKQAYVGVSEEGLRDLGGVFYRALIDPVAAHLKGKKDLIIVPDGELGLVPFETFVDGRKKYLIESYDIRYVQSLTVWQLVGNRVYRDDRLPMLAFGGAVYEQPSAARDRITDSELLAALKKRVAAAFGYGRSLRGEYAELGLGAWRDLPGTQAEVRSVAENVKGTEVLTGGAVTEDAVKRMSASGELARYKVLHFATHGIVVPEMPELSALVLSQYQQQRGQEDGYLRMGEVAQLRLKADFVNLSACDSGTGKVYGGEGVVGLSQSFLIAGANSLSVSLWQVADKSTAVFMKKMYEARHKKGCSYAQALSETKRKFLKGKYGRQYSAPYSWAPFVYYGR